LSVIVPLSQWEPVVVNSIVIPVIIKPTVSSFLALVKLDTLPVDESVVQGRSSRLFRRTRTALEWLTPHRAGPLSGTAPLGPLLGNSFYAWFQVGFFI
jgi:hypothetical protein